MHANSHFFFIFFLTCFLILNLSLSWSQTHPQFFDQSKNYEGSSDLIDLKYHMGPVLSSYLSLYVVWYGKWNPTHQSTIRDFLYSLSSPAPYPSVADWWRTVRMYTDQTGSNVTGNIVLSGEFYDSQYSHGTFLTRLSIQSVIKTAVTTKLPLNGHNGLYLVLTSDDVQVQEFCRAICGFHYFTFPNIVGGTVPYAWVGYSRMQCPTMCAYPFAQPKPPPGSAYNIGRQLMKPPNGEAGIDGMISVIGHELAEVSSNPLLNGWYAGDDPTAPAEIADLCLGVYGSGGGGGYMGSVYRNNWGDGYNVNGVKGRKFLVQWVWDPTMKRCFGPNAMD